MRIILISVIMIVLGTILTGIYYDSKKKQGSKKTLKKVLLYNLSIFIPLLLMAIAIVIPDIVYAATQGASDVNGLGLIAVAIATGLATIGAGNAVGAVGSSALGAISEDPDILGKTLIYVGLAEGIAIYGLIISILILGRL